MLFDLNTHIIATGDTIIYNNVDEVSVTETQGFAANSGGLYPSKKSHCEHLISHTTALAQIFLERVEVKLYQT